MSDSRRLGNRTSRKTGGRIPRLGYYIIATDGEQTEKNYLHGLRDSIPEQYRGSISITVITCKTGELVEKLQDASGYESQYAERWIVIDRDRVSNFDNFIISSGARSISVGWSNPCIETWFHAHFGSMPTCTDSQDCRKQFENEFKRKTGKGYSKSEPKIYETLREHGDEAQAINLAEQKLDEAERNGKKTPSKMSPCTTIHRLVAEIKSKI